MCADCSLSAIILILESFLRWVSGSRYCAVGQRMGRNNSVLKPYSCSRAMLILLAALLAFVPLAPSATSAQVAGGSVTGTVRGDTGLAMPGVRVSITDVSSSATRTVTTDT